MHLVALPFVAILTMGASDKTATPSPANPQEAVGEFTFVDPLARKCRDGASSTNEQQAGQPLLEREPATLNEGTIIYAVDRRINGCSVILVKNGGPNSRYRILPSDLIARPSPPEQGK